MPERSDERQREAVLLAYQGEPMSTITARLGVTEAQVQNWLAGMAAEAHSASSPARPGQRGDRRQLAQTLLDGGEFLSAGRPEEEDEEADVFIFFNDLAAHEFYDLVERSVDVVSAVEGVDRAVARRPGAGLRDGRRRPCNLERRASPLVGGAAQTKGAPARSARAAPCCGQSLRYRTPC